MTGFVVVQHNERYCCSYLKKIGLEILKSFQTCTSPHLMTTVLQSRASDQGFIYKTVCRTHLKTLYTETQKVHKNNLIITLIMRTHILHLFLFLNYS